MGPHYDDIYPSPRDPPAGDRTLPPGEGQAHLEEILRQNTLSREKTEAQIINLHRRLNQSEVNVLELQAKLKETIRAVERLAKGKSLGTLGLPTEESWQKSIS